MDLFSYLLSHRIEANERRRRFERMRDRGAARRRSEALAERVEELEDEVGQMALFVRTLFRLLAEKGTIDRAEFVEVARAIDVQDGAADGRYTGPLDAP